MLAHRAHAGIGKAGDIGNLVTFNIQLKDISLGGSKISGSFNKVIKQDRNPTGQGFF